MNVELAAEAVTDPSGLLKAFSEGRVEGASRPIQRIDTHLSHVFISEGRAYKLKRAVRMPFVDFSAAELRRAACQAELETNRRLGSPLYLDVLAVARRRDGSFCLGGEGDIVDWVVVMRRFDQSQQFDELAKSGKLTAELVLRTADRIAALHDAAAPSKLAGHAADYRHVIRNLRKTEADGAGKLGLIIGDPAPFDALDAELVRVDPLIERRRSRGKVRRGHGDLHLRNICLFEGKPEPFDALEFDERLATTDVLYDLAFFLMDLRRVGLAAQANAAMNRYWDTAQEDEEGLRLLPFFMALRATVRMTVAIEAGQLVEAHAYRRLAFELLTHRPPALVAIGGLSGTGKSEVAKIVASELPGPAGARLLRSDVLRKRALGLVPEEARAKADAYAPAQRAQTYRDLGSHVVEAVAAGASVVADATFTVSSAREAILSIPRACTKAFWLSAPPSVRLARIAARRQDASDADVRVALAQTEPVKLGPRWRRLDATRPVDATAADILQEVRQAGAAAELAAARGDHGQVRQMADRI